MNVDLKRCSDWICTEHEICVTVKSLTEALDAIVEKHPDDAAVIDRVRMMLLRWESDNIKAHNESFRSTIDDLYDRLRDAKKKIEKPVVKKSIWAKIKAGGN